MTTKKQTILLERLEKYCKQLGVSPIPKIIWSLKEVKAMPRSIVGSRHKNHLGFCCNRANLIFINYNAHHSGLRSLDHTLRHELIHYRFTGVQHGPAFEKKIKELKAGKIWPPKDRADYINNKIERFHAWAFRAFWRMVERK